jgi:two-component system chemotaxis response regulator CheB
MAIKVLIIDDSMIFREIIARGISSSPEITVVAKAVDAYDARDKILAFEPDVVTCDIQMPKMDGIEFVRRLMPQYPLPVIVVSSVSNRVFDAMEAGAVDFVTKPSPEVSHSVQSFIIELIDKIKAAASARVLPEIKVPIIKETSKSYKHHELIAIGASTGGTEAIFNVLKQLPKKIPGIVIVQHIPPIFSKMFAERLNNQTHFEVKEAENNDLIKEGHVYLAPGDFHMEVNKRGSQYYLKVFKDEKVNGHCPSVDVLFNSLSKVAGSHVIGVILTGMGYDGARGLSRMRRSGSLTIGQDQKTCVVYGMPKAAFELGAVEKQVPLGRVGHTIIQMLR